MCGQWLLTISLRGDHLVESEVDLGVSLQGREQQVERFTRKQLCHFTNEL